MYINIPSDNWYVKRMNKLEQKTIHKDQGILNEHINTLLSNGNYSYRIIEISFLK